MTRIPINEVNPIWGRGEISSSVEIKGHVFKISFVVNKSENRNLLSHFYIKDVEGWKIVSITDVADVDLDYWWGFVAPQIFAYHLDNLVLDKLCDYLYQRLCVDEEGYLCLSVRDEEYLEEIESISDDDLPF
jgi:hypothetical protein